MAHPVRGGKSVSTDRYPEESFVSPSLLQSSPAPVMLPAPHLTGSGMCQCSQLSKALGQTPGRQEMCE